MKKLCFLFTFLVLLVNNPADALENDNLNQQIELIGVTRIEGTARDLSGLATPLFPRQAETQTFANSKPLPAGAPDAIPEPNVCLLYTSPSPRDKRQSRMPSSA